MPTIEIRELTKTIRHNTVIDNISVTFTPGQIIGLKGINGSGKTMLMRLILGLISPTSGKVLIDGKEIGKDISFPPSVGALIENPAFLGGYSGRENLKLLAEIKGIIGYPEIDEILKTVGLTDADNKKYRKYSLGMKQRLGIAAAVMESPEIIILDEPTNSLDSDGVEMVKELVIRERSKGALIIIACHELETLKYLSDIIYTIECGKITGCIKKEDF